MRRVTFYLKQNGTNRLVFSIIDETLPSFDDHHDADQPPFILHRAEKPKAPNSRDKIYMAIDYFQLTPEFVENPFANYELSDDTPIVGATHFASSPEKEELMWTEDCFRATHLFGCFPRTKRERYLKAWIDTDRDTERLLTDPATKGVFMQQLSAVSSEYYGADLSKFPEGIGNIYLIAYNPYFHDIDWKISPNPSGIYVVLSRNPGVTGELKAEFVNRSHEGLLEYMVSHPLPLDRTYQFFPLPDTPDRLDIYIRDDQGELVYASRDTVFLRKFEISMHLQSERLDLTHPSGKRESVDRYNTENFGIGDNPPAGLVLSSSSEAFRLLEENLDFAFFNGCKDDPKEMEANKERARNFVRRIMATARKECIIADPYFNLEALSDFVFTIANRDLEISIIGSTENLLKDIDKSKNSTHRKEEAKDIVAALKTYSETTGDSNIRFRLLRGGKSPLHDRYIVADDTVWLVGTSFNEIGARVSTIVKLSPETGRVISAELKRWWNDDRKTQQIEDYAVDPALTSNEKIKLQ